MSGLIKEACSKTGQAQFETAEWNSFHEEAGEERMKYDFTTILDRRGHDSIAVEPTAWYNINTETKPGFQRIPMWVADMSFPTCPSVTKAIADRLSHPCFGYFEPREEYYEAIRFWQKERNHTDVTKEDIGYQNGVLGGVLSALRVLCSPGDNVLFHSPTYIGFTNSAGSYGYHMIHSPLKKDEQGIWRMDFADMERKIIENSIHAAVVCNPYNPCGRVWTREELTEMMALFEKHQVWVVADEIWSDILLNGHVHVPCHSVSEYARMHTVTQYAPSKTFSLAGIVGSYHVCFNPWLNDRVKKESQITHYNQMSVLWMYAMIGGFSKEGTEWVDELCAVLSENINYACGFIEEHFEGVKVMKPEGTYMLLLDCRDYCTKTGTDLLSLLKRGVEYGVLWQDGRPFHEEYGIRMNLAVPFTLVKEAFDRLDRYVFIGGNE